MDKDIDLRDYFATHASQKEVDRIVPSAAGDLLDFIGVRYPSQEALRAIRHEAHIPMAHAKARYIIADTMMKVRSK